MSIVRSGVSSRLTKLYLARLGMLFHCDRRVCDGVSGRIENYGNEDSRRLGSLGHSR